MSREDKVVEEERAFGRREERDSRLSGCSCTELELTSDVAGGNKGRREEDEGDEATTGEEGSFDGELLPSSGESGGGGPRERGGQLMGGKVEAHGSVCKRERERERVSSG